MSTRALLLAVLTLGTAVPAEARQVQDERTGRVLPGVVGTVVDRETRRPVEGARVVLRPQDPLDSLPRPDPVLTDDDGRFVVGGLLDGRYTLSLDAFGYRAVEDTVGFQRELGLRVDVQMVPEAVELEPLLVVTEVRSRNLQVNGFYDRRVRGLGRFVSRDEMAARLFPRVSDLFRMMPGVRMSPGGPFGDQGVVLLRGGCVADVYVDGVATVSPFPVDALLGPGQLDGVEVYHAGQMPPRFGTSSCGAVLFWTHTPNRGVGGAWSWKRFMAAVGFLGASLLLLR